MSKAIMRKKHALTLGVLLMGCSVGAFAAPSFFLNKTIVRHIPQQDLPSLRTTLGEVLNHAPDGASRSWSSGKAQSPQQIKLQITPVQTAQTRAGGTCRLLNADVARMGQAENWRFWFCKQPDGGWKSSGGSLPG